MVATKKQLIQSVKRAIAARRGKRGYGEPQTEAQLERVYNLRAMGPLSVRAIDVDLAKMGWIEIYDDEPGNESVDFTHPKSMDASDKLEKAQARIYAPYRRR